MNGKERFIKMMAADELGVKTHEVTEAQYEAAEKLFLAMAHDATPERLAELKSELRTAV